jgi:hypothetical protein
MPKKVIITVFIESGEPINQITMLLTGKRQEKVYYGLEDFQN